MSKKNPIKKKKYFVEYTHHDLDFTVSYHVVSFIDYRKFADTLRLILDNDFCSITSVYTDTVFVYRDN